MKNQFEKRFEEELQKIHHAIHSKRGVKKLDKVHQRIRFQLKNNKINSCWKQIVRTGNTQKVITTTGTNTFDRTVVVRKCSQPNESLAAIYDILKSRYKPFTKRKSVVHKLELKKNETQQQAVFELG